jgi:hypothetical protein
MGLGPVPGASVRRSQPGHHPHQVQETPAFLSGGNRSRGDMAQGIRRSVQVGGSHRPILGGRAQGASWIEGVGSGEVAVRSSTAPLVSSK